MQIQLDQNDAQAIIQDLKEYAMTLSNALGYNTTDILEEMDQENSVQVIDTFNKYFGEYIELLDSDQMVISKKKFN